MNGGPGRRDQYIGTFEDAKLLGEIHVGKLVDGGDTT